MSNGDEPGHEPGRRWPQRMFGAARFMLEGWLMVFCRSCLACTRTGCAQWYVVIVPR